MKNIKSLNLVQVAQILFLLLSGIWCVLGVVRLFRPDEVNLALTPISIVMPLLMFANAAALLFCAWAVGQQKGKLDYLILTVLIFNLSLTVTDQFGWLDALVLGLYVILLGMVVVLRSRTRGVKRADHPGTEGANRDSGDRDA